MKKWQCTVCGYVHEGEEPPDECPVCGADKSQFVLLGETPTETDSEKTTGVKDADSNTGPILKWRCSVCGYIHEGIEPPDICPVCGADKSQFDLVEEENDKVEEKPAASKPQAATQTSAQAGKDAHPGAFPFSSARFEPISQLLTRFHGHPIAVHIPNGVLPVAFIFTLIALLFNSPGFAIAAKYNIILVALAMPLVIMTGLIDWNNRYKRRMTTVFMVKMICAGIVTLFSILIGIWWIIRPEIYTAGFSASGLFLFINVVNLGAAIVAGWYGGKLVFKN